VPITRDQQRAAFAYRTVKEEHERGKCFGEYEGVVQGLGAVILRCGLVGAIAWLYRKGEAGKCVAKHLAQAGIPGLSRDADQLLPSVCELGVSDYMVATREALKGVSWLKRAVQAMPKPESKPKAGDHA